MFCDDNVIGAEGADTNFRKIMVRSTIKGAKKSGAYSKKAYFYIENPKFSHFSLETQQFYPKTAEKEVFFFVIGAAIFFVIGAVRG